MHSFGLKRINERKFAMEKILYRVFSRVTSHLYIFTPLFLPYYLHYLTLYFILFFFFLFLFFFHSPDCVRLWQSARKFDMENLIAQITAIQMWIKQRQNLFSRCVAHNLWRIFLRMGMGYRVEDKISSPLSLTLWLLYLSCYICLSFFFLSFFILQIYT